VKQIKAVTLQFDEKKNGFISLLDARTSFLTCKQGPQQTPDAYLETLRAWADAIEYYGGSVAENHELIPDRAPDGSIRTIAMRKTMARDQTLAIALVRGADPRRYGTLITELSNQYAMGMDNYPTDLTAAYGLLVNYKTPVNSGGARREQQASPEASAMTFAQQGAVPGASGAVHEHITCFNCHNMGHYASDCPSSTGVTIVQYGFNLTQAPCKAKLSNRWILLDTQSTISVFNNPTMLTNIRASDHTLRAFTNGGYQDSNFVGDFPNLGPVWYNSESIANILSLSHVRKVCRITMDTSIENALCVHRLDGSIMRFVEQPSGLYVYDVDGNNVSVNAYTFVSSVAQNKDLFTRRQVAAADTARELYRKIGRPDEAEFQSILRKNLIRNCPVTPDDARRALVIYGPDIATIKGKMTRAAAAQHVPSFQAVPLPAPIAEHHRNVTLCTDFFFVQGLAFLHTISRNIGFRTVAPVQDRSKPTILRGELRAVLSLYSARGLTVHDIHADNEFECVREEMRPSNMNVVPADSHVGEIERSIRTVKERMRSTAHGLPFKRLPRVMVRELAASAVHDGLNQFPWKHGISTTLSPSAIVTGQPLPDYNHMRIELGAYAQVFEDHQGTRYFVVYRLTHNFGIYLRNFIPFTLVQYRFLSFDQCD